MKLRATHPTNNVVEVPRKCDDTCKLRKTLQMNTGFHGPSQFDASVVVEADVNDATTHVGDAHSCPLDILTPFFVWESFCDAGMKL